VPDRNGKIFYTSITSLSHISKSATLEAALFLFFRISNSRACQARELKKEKTRFCMMHSTAKRKPQNEKAD